MREKSLDGVYSHVLECNVMRGKSSDGVYIVTCLGVACSVGKLVSKQGT